MNLDRLVRALLLCDAALFLGFGFGYAVLIEPLASGSGSKLTPAFQTDLGATAGGLQIAIGIALFARASRPVSRSREGLALAALATLAVAVVRGASLLKWGAWSAGNAILLSIELLGCVCNGGLFWWARRSTPPGVTDAETAT